MDYHKKYLKYKMKYLTLQNSIDYIGDDEFTADQLNIIATNYKENIL